MQVSPLLDSVSANRTKWGRAFSTLASPSVQSEAFKASKPAWLKVEAMLLTAAASLSMMSALRVISFGGIPGGFTLATSPRLQ